MLGGVSMKKNLILILIYNILIHSIPVVAKDTTSVNNESSLFLQICICLALLLISCIIFIIYFQSERKEDNPLKLSLYPSRKIPIALCSYIQYGEVAPQDILPLFIQWAQHGFLHISEEGAQIYLVKKHSLPDHVSSYERYIFATIFQQQSKVCVNELNDPKFSNIWEKTNKLIEETIETNTAHKIYRKASLFLISLQAICISIPVFLIAFSAIYPFTQLIKESLFYSSLSAIGISICYVLWGIRLQKDEAFMSLKQKNNFFLLNITTSIIMIIIIKLLIDVKANILYIAISFASILFISSLLLFNGSRTRRGYTYLQDIWKIQNCIMHIRYTHLEQLLQRDSRYYYIILPYAYALKLDMIWKAKFETIIIPYPHWFETTKICTHPHERLERIHFCIDSLYQYIQTWKQKED